MPADHPPGARAPSVGAGVLVCVDVGSTFTKAAAIGSDGTVLATAQHPTTSDSDVLAGLDAAVAGLGVGGVPDSSIVVCSSAGGGLRLAVVGHERVISAEAGRRVALSAGARVVAVSAGLLDDAGIDSLAAARPDVVLVVGGTDGGDTEVLLHNARVLGRSRLRVPVVLAGNADAAAEAAALLGARRRVVLPTANVIPRIGALHPGPARRAIREVFIAHVIGGKGLSSRPQVPGAGRLRHPGRRARGDRGGRRGPRRAARRERGRHGAGHRGCHDRRLQRDHPRRRGSRGGGRDPLARPVGRGRPGDALERPGRRRSGTGRTPAGAVRRWRPGRVPGARCRASPRGCRLPARDRSPDGRRARSSRGWRP